MDVYDAQKFFFIMENSTNIKIDAQPIQNNVKTKFKKKKCNECNKRRTPSVENNQICHVCYEVKKKIIPSGNSVIDDFIKFVQTKYVKSNGKMVFVPYEKFKDLELIGEGGFSKIYKADCQISDWGTHIQQIVSKTVALKKLNNSKNITSKELNEVNILH
jgi:hypothetical protein